MGQLSSGPDFCLLFQVAAKSHHGDDGGDHVEVEFERADSQLANAVTVGCENGYRQQVVHVQQSGPKPDPGSTEDRCGDIEHQHGGQHQQGCRYRLEGEPVHRLQICYIDQAQVGRIVKGEIQHHHGNRQALCHHQPQQW